jgi:hypothetical protein
MRVIQFGIGEAVESARSTDRGVQRSVLAGQPLGLPDRQIALTD